METENAKEDDKGEEKWEEEGCFSDLVALAVLDFLKKALWI